MKFSRLKQTYSYFFISFTVKMEEEVKTFLNEEEFHIFIKMEEYDKVHSYYLWKKLQRSSLKDNKLYYKLALLHDCGKEKKSFLSRCYTVIFDRKKKRDNHPQKAYEKLQEINYALAVLCYEHHQKAKTKEMKLFQELDDG